MASAGRSRAVKTNTHEITALIYKSSEQKSNPKAPSCKKVHAKAGLLILKKEH